MTLEAVVFDVDFTLAKPGPDLGPGGLPQARRALRPRPRPRPLRAGAPRRDRDAEAAPRARPRRGGLGALHRADHPGHGRHRRHVCVRGRDDARVGARRPLRALRGRAAGARRSARARAEARRCSRTPAATSTSSSRTTASRSTRSSPRASTGRRSRTRRSSARCSRSSTSRRTPPRWSATIPRTTSRGARAVGMQAWLVDRDGRFPQHPQRLTDLRGASRGARSGDRIRVDDMAWVIWAILAVLLALGELATPGLFFLGPVALATLPALFVAFFGGPAWLQVLVFIVGLARVAGDPAPDRALAPAACPRSRAPGTAALVGARATVLAARRRRRRPRAHRRRGMVCTRVHGRPGARARGTRRGREDRRRDRTRL